MKYALVGCGRISVNHIKAAINNKFDIVGLCDVLPCKMEDVLKFCHPKAVAQIKLYENYTNMLLELKPDIVSIATESGYHAQIALDCIRTGINVIIEKPMAMSIHDANQIISESKVYNVKVSVCHQNRYNRAVQELKKALDAGRFGKLSHGAINVRWNRGRDYYTQASWRGTWALDGGALMNQCIHGIDLLRWIFGDNIEEVYGTIRQQFHPYLEAEDIGVAVVKFRNGAIATIEGSTNVYPKNLEETLYVFGEKGTVKLGGTSVNNVEEWIFADETEFDAQIRCLCEQTSNVYGNGHAMLFADFAKAIQNDEHPYVDAVAGKNALECVLAIYESQKRGIPIKFPISDFATTDMVGIFKEK